MSNFQVGDRVMVVWGDCPCARQEIGNKFEISAIEIGDCYCPICGTGTPFQPLAYCSDDGWMPLAWLIKLPPDTDVIEEKETDEVEV